MLIQDHYSMLSLLVVEMGQVSYLVAHQARFQFLIHLHCHWVQIVLRLRDGHNIMIIIIRDLIL